MFHDIIHIRPIKPDEWLPDRCLTGSEPFDPASDSPGIGCSSLNCLKSNTRESLEQLYKLAINKYGGCGFIAWEENKVIAYHNFFPREIAQEIKFYGYGVDSNQTPKTLVHNCLTIVKGTYLRRGISTRLVKKSIAWAETNGWERFEIHSVLPDCEQGWQDQKSCLSFWEQFGFSVFCEYDADDITKEYYGVSKRYSMYLPFTRHKNK